MQERLGKFAGPAVGALLFSVYATTASRTVGFIDNGELATVVHTLGIAHPTGYPLFTLVGGLILQLPLGLREIFHLNLFSAAAAAAAGALMYGLLYEMLRDPLRQRRRETERPGAGTDPGAFWGALVGALSFGFSRTLWEQATSLEVYSLHAVFIVLLLRLALRGFGWGSGDGSNRDEYDPVAGRRYRWLFAFCTGMAFTNHGSVIFLAPGLLYYYFSRAFAARAGRRGRPEADRNAPIRTREVIRDLGAMALWFAAGFSIYLYLPVRAASEPVMNWGNPATLEAVIRHLVAKQYSVWIFSSSETALRQLKHFFSTLPDQFGLATLVFLIPGVTAIRKGPRGAAVLVALLFAGCVAFAINYDIHDIDSYFLLAHAAIAIVAGFGAAAFVRHAAGWKFRKSVPALLLAVALFPGVASYGPADRSENARVEEYARDIFASVDSGGIIISFQWDYFVSAAYYLQVVENLRSDVVIVDKELLRRSWYFEHLNRRAPWLIANSRAELDAFLPELLKFERGLPYDPARIERLYAELILSFVGNNRETRPVYVTGEIEAAYTQGYERIPSGLLFRLVPPGAGIPWRDVSLPVRPFEAGDLSDKYMDGITMLRAQAELNNALYLRFTGDTDRARIFVKRSLQVRPDYQDARRVAASLGLGGAGGTGEI